MWQDEKLLLNGTSPSKEQINHSLRDYENQGCQCGKGLDCPLMLYLLTDDFDEEEDDVEFEQPFPESNELSMEEEWNSQNMVADMVDEEHPGLFTATKVTFDEADEHNWNDDEVVEPLPINNTDNRYDFTADQGVYQPNPMTSYNENDLVQDVFRESNEIYHDEQKQLEQTGAGHLMDDVEQKATQIATFTDTTVRLQRENKLLREKMQEIEGQVNQQLREISIRQKEAGHVEDKVKQTGEANKYLIKGMVTCLKLLKFLPDTQKMNFKNSQDYRIMLEIYKKYVEPHKGDIK